MERVARASSRAATAAASRAGTVNARADDGVARRARDDGAARAGGGVSFVGVSKVSSRKDDDDGSAGDSGHRVHGGDDGGDADVRAHDRETAVEARARDGGVEGVVLGARSVLSVRGGERRWPRRTCSTRRERC